jgi:hypothetical protein
MKVVVLIAMMLGTSFQDRNVAAMERCFEKYSLCLGYCDKLKSLCALRCDDHRLLCERMPIRKHGPKTKAGPVLVT